MADPLQAERTSAAARIAQFCDEYDELSGLDPDVVYGLHRGHPKQAEVRISDLRTLVAPVSESPPPPEVAFSEWFEKYGLWPAAQSTEPTPALAFSDEIDSLEREALKGGEFVGITNDFALRLVAEVRRGRLVATNLAEALRPLVDEAQALEWVVENDRGPAEVDDPAVAAIATARAALREYETQAGEK